MENHIHYITIRLLGDSERPLLAGLVDKLGHNFDAAYFDGCFEKQQAGTLDIYMALYRGEPAGYCLLNWQPKYGLFQKLGIPEIQDLNVVRALRRKGIGTSMISYCEDKARQKGNHQIGIGVGLGSSFGAAQRLYVKMGYVPDGSGVTYDRKQLAYGDLRPNDEQLCLMMLKSLGREA